MPSTRRHIGSLENALRALSARCAEGDPPSAGEVEGALERGFSQLIVLEAELQRLTTAPAAGERDVAIDEDPWTLAELMEQIASLHEALEDLRGRTSERGTAPLALGFVFPSSR